MIASPNGSPHALFPVRALAVAEGYAMVSRAGAAPFIITEEKWAAAPLQEGS